MFIEHLLYTSFSEQVTPLHGREDCDSGEFAPKVKVLRTQV